MNAVESRQQKCSPQRANVRGAWRTPYGGGRVSKVTARFWAKVDRSAGLNECWPWTGSRLPSGYGQFAPNHKPVRAHRYSYELHNGEIPAGLIICHRCDNPPCVNPAHLYAGTYVDNSRDMYDRGRAPARTREREHLEVDRAIVRRMRASGATRTEVARLLHMSTRTVDRLEGEPP